MADRLGLVLEDWEVARRAKAYVALLEITDPALRLTLHGSAFYLVDSDWNGLADALSHCNAAEVGYAVGSTGLLALIESAGSNGGPTPEMAAARDAILASTVATGAFCRMLTQEPWINDDDVPPDVPRDNELRQPKATPVQVTRDGDCITSYACFSLKGPLALLELLCREDADAEALLRKRLAGSRWFPGLAHRLVTFVRHYGDDTFSARLASIAADLLRHLAAIPAARTHILAIKDRTLDTPDRPDRRDTGVSLVAALAAKSRDDSERGRSARDLHGVLFPAPPQSPRTTTTCAACGSAGARAVCGRCRAVTFCGVACQRKGWKAHKATCRAPPPA